MSTADRAKMVQVIEQALDLMTEPGVRSVHGMAYHIADKLIASGLPPETPKAWAEEDVERAARRMATIGNGGLVDPWELRNKSAKTRWMNLARAALLSVLPVAVWALIETKPSITELELLMMEHGSLNVRITEDGNHIQVRSFEPAKGEP